MAKHISQPASRQPVQEKAQVPAAGTKVSDSTKFDNDTDYRVTVNKVVSIGPMQLRPSSARIVLKGSVAASIRQHLATADKV